MQKIIETIAQELNVKNNQVESAVKLIDEGNTIPFIARYRKEVTGGLSDETLRELGERLTYLRNLEQRKQEIIKSIEEQGKLTDQISKSVEIAKTLAEVEDIYRPYKQKKKTRATIAKAKGLEPLAKIIYDQKETKDINEIAKEYITATDEKPMSNTVGVDHPGDPNTSESTNKSTSNTVGANVPGDQNAPEPTNKYTSNNVGVGLLGDPNAPEPTNKPTSNEYTVSTAEEAIAGALDIIAEIISDEPKYRKEIKRLSYKMGLIKTKAVNEEEKSSYEMYYDYQETIRTIPSHRILAINRGEKEKFLKVTLEKPEENILEYIRRDVIKGKTQFTNMLEETILDSYKRLIEPSIDREIRSDLSEKAEEKAIKVFGQNAKQLLLGAPIKDIVVMGFDPAYRTGCKIAIIDDTGKLLEYTTVYPTEPQNDVEGAEKELLKLIEKHRCKYDSDRKWNSFKRI